jgi:hypothetical protein
MSGIRRMSGQSRRARPRPLGKDKETIEWVIDDLSDHDDVTAPALGEDVSEVAALPPALSSEERAPGWRKTAVLCVAGRGSLDEAAAMLAQLLAKHVNYGLNCGYSKQQSRRSDTCACFL